METIQIGNQIWMSKNLDVDRFRNGELIPEAKTQEEWILAGKKKRPAWCYNGKKYGKLYNWYAVNDKRDLAPEGWHIPTYAEMLALKASLNNDGNALKAVGQGSGSGVGTNTSGFSVLLAGYRLDGNFYDSGSLAIFWSSTEYNASHAYYMPMYGDNSTAHLGHGNKSNGFSVRCVKN